MNTVRKIAYGITLSSLTWLGISQRVGQKAIAASTEEGSLTLIVNGEDFVRQGFVSKDGWKINFDHVYVNFAEANAYTTESSFEPEKGDTKESIKHQGKVEFLNSPKTVDLAAGGTDAEPIAVAKVSVPTGFYNALSWELSPADPNSAISGNTLALIGQATKDGNTINFNLSFNQPAEYVCGEFIGESRQGIVETDTPAKTEATFHFDHIFGDRDAPAEDALNQNALGFEPFANLANSGQITLGHTDLAQQLSPQDYQQLEAAVIGLGHVGEGHCVVTSSQ